MRKRIPAEALTYSRAKAIAAQIQNFPDIVNAFKEYPWAAKMKSVCNLHRVTIPGYMENGTPKVSILSHVLLEGIGELMLISKPWLDPTSMGEAKILVEIKVNKPFPQKISPEDTSGSVTMVDVLYSWLP
ncbi:unnamed protein product [Thlaspi arvense]|uniref:Uncharacterized protein n=1 Tax=Thlaspi arvense TaxID=13288 RepID=A0AAU9SCE2_THLAR|nr:unnamed protein product [Thlaspi arvense]